MTTEPGKGVPVRFTPEFKRNLRHLGKKYRHIHDDIQPVIAQLEQGGMPGDRISGIEQEVYKVRARNSDAGKGKSGGYRVIYHVRPDASIILVTIYSKSEQGDVAAAEIRKIISAHEAISEDAAENPDVQE